MSAMDEMSMITESMADNWLGDEEDDSENASCSANQQLFGRAAESQVLLNAYQRMIHTHTAETILVHGESGSGKTSLIDGVLRDSVSASNGFFCEGKYFQGGGVQEPYSAIMAAFSDLCDLTRQSEDFDEARQKEIQQSLGANASLLAKTISSVATLLDYSEKDSFDRKNDSALQKFKIACKTFLHVMSSSEHPIVIFLDDVQWIDEGSRQLLETLLRDTELRNVTLILAYRDEEAEPVDSLIASCPANDRITDLQINNLDSDAVHQMVTSSLSCDSDSIKELSDLIMIKTKGQPLHVSHFIDTIKQEDLLKFDTTSGIWVFSLDTIQNEMMIANGVADLLLRKLRRLPEYSLELLKVASLLGYRFAEETLMDIVPAITSLSGQDFAESSVSGAPTRSVAVYYLREAIKEGYLERTKAVREGLGEPQKHGYQFSHDKVQSSLQSMITYEEVCRLHLFIGEMYLARQDREYVYPAAVHLNRAPNFWQDHEQRIELVRINLEASKVCSEKSAFAESAAFLGRGLALLDKDTMWDAQFDLAFELTESLAKMELIIGNLDDCKRTTEVALERGKTVEMKCNSLIIDVEARMAGIEMDETISAANRALKVLGVKLPAKVGFQHILLKLWKVKRLLRHKTDEDILGLPVMTDRIKATTIKLLMNLALYCLLKDDLERGVVSALLALQLTLKGGLSPYSANALTIYGVAEVTLGNQKSGYRFGKLAFRMLEHMKYKETECATLGMSLASLIHWGEPLRALQEPFQEAMDIGFDVGDVVFGTFCASNCFATRVVLGEDLPSLERFMRTCYIHISDLSQDALTLWVQPGLQFVLNLQTNATRWADVITLTGEIMNENDYYYEVDTTKNKALHTMVRLYKSMLAFNFGYYGLASALFGEMADGSKAFKDTFGVLPLYFYGALTSYSLFRENGKRKELWLARKNMKGLLRMKAAGNPNVVPFLALLEAEELSLRKRMGADALVTAYGEAISSSAREGYTHMEALANERAASALALLVSRAESEKYFDRALLLYRRWGATAKHEWLEEKKSEFHSARAEDPIRSQESLVGGIISIGTSKTQAVP